MQVSMIGTHCITERSKRFYRQKEDFDVLHFHLDYFPLSQFARQNIPFVSTLHGRLDLPELVDVYAAFPHAPFISIFRQSTSSPAKSELEPHGAARLAGGFADTTACEAGIRGFLGRICPEKGVDRAIRIASRAGLKLKIAAKVDNADKEYYDSKIKPLIKANSNVECNRRDQRSAKAGVLIGRTCVALSGQLVGAVRPCDDRGNGVRHAGDRLSRRFGAGSD